MLAYKPACGCVCYLRRSAVPQRLSSTQVLGTQRLRCRRLATRIAGPYWSVTVLAGVFSGRSDSRLPINGVGGLCEKRLDIRMTEF